MKRILLSLALILGVTGAVAGVTAAYFSDQAQSTGNTFSVGTMDLKLSDNNETDQDNISASFGGDNLYPGQTLPEQSMTVKNTGTISGNHLDLRVTLTTETNTQLADKLYFPYTPDSYNGLRFGASASLSDSANLANYLRGTTDGDYNFFTADGATDLVGYYSANPQITLRDLVNLGTIRIVPVSNNEGIAALSTAYLYIHPTVDTSLTEQGNSVVATFTWTLHQDASQF